MNQSKILDNSPIAQTSSQESKAILSIIIVNYKTPELTKRCVESIYQNKPSIPFEVIVVNNGYSSKLAHFFLRQHPKLIFHQTGFNAGFAKGVNQGMLRASGEYILLLNSDAKIDQGIFKSMLDYLKDNPDVGILGPREVDEKGKFVPSCGKFPTLITEMIRKIIHYRLSVDDYKLREYIDERHSILSDVDWISGSCLMIRRGVLYDTGLLDESFFMYFEDIDFCQRASMQGWKVRYYPGATIIHEGGQSARLNIMKVMLENRRSQLYFSQKHHGYLGALVIRMFLLTKYAINFIKWSLLYLRERSSGRSYRAQYTRMLISKKVIDLCFSKGRAEPVIPLFHPYIIPIHENSV